MAHLTVSGYELDPDRRYDPDSNIWVAELGCGLVQVGYDPLGAETAGDIVAISFAAEGSWLQRGEPLAIVEAAKFVGPLPAPVSGVVVATNPDVTADPSAINRDPLGAWLVELDGVVAGELGELLTGERGVAQWFAGAVERFRAQGVIAE